MRATHQQHGFTLLELLIALVIVSLIMTAAFGGVRIGGRSWEAGHTHADATEDMRAVSNFLRQQLAQTAPLSWQDASGSRIAFEGFEDGFRFVAPAPFESGNVGLMVYSIGIDHRADASDLLLAYDPFDPGAKDFGSYSTDNRILLASAGESVSISYFGAIDSESSRSWFQQWPSSATLFPLLLRIDFGTSEDETAWPALVLPLRSRQLP